MQAFLGRKEELKILSHKLLDEKSPTNLICISGETGIGKTSLAHQLLKADELMQRFEKIQVFTAYMESDWDRLVTNITGVLDIPLAKKMTSREIIQKIITLITGKSVLLLLDNIDELYRNCPAEVITFIKEWLARGHKSTLFLTIRDNPFKNRELHECSNLKKCYVCTLGGIPDDEEEDDAVKRLLGEDLTKLIEEHKMWGKLNPLGNNPQKLLYLRWWKPENKEELNKYIKNIARGLSEEGPLEMVLRKTRLPLVHFLALGHIRETEVDETFLAFLWDRLGGGSTEIYVKTLKFLLSENLLIQDNPIDRFKFRISAGVHMKLQQPMQMLVGVSQIHYFISVYYRNLFTYSSEETPELHYLERYVYHALLFGAFDQVYTFVFERDIFENAHKRGLSLWLKPILENFNRHWSGLLQKNTLQTADNKKIAQQGIQIKIELGNIYKDLSLHQLCLECMEEAEEILRTPASREIPDDKKRKFKRNILYFSAVSSSNLGRSFDCLNFYYRIVKNAIEGDKFEPLDVLSLGYLAHELRYHEIEKAKELGERALQLIEILGDKDTTIKNKCSLAQTLFFMGKTEGSKEIFNEAYNPSTNGESDLREVGRILVHSIPVYIALEEWDEAQKRFDKGLEMNKKQGDRRRAATAEAYHAIMLYRKGEKKQGKEKMWAAIKQHREINDWRNLPNEVLSYVWMINPGLIDGLLQLIKREDLIKPSPGWAPVPQVKKKGKYDVFLSYNSLDKNEVKKICQELKNRELSPWWDDEEIDPGKRFEEVLERVIAKIPTAVVFMGKNGLSLWQRNEIHAYIRKYKDGEGNIIPVILPDCEIDPAIPLSLEGFVRLDFRKNDSRPLDRLIWAITGQKQDETRQEEPRGTTFEDSLRQLCRGMDFPPEIEEIITHIHHDKHLHIFVDFWAKHFKPQLLEL